ncbi:MAG: hypothetical protein R3293_28275 [Candidatus Promineifilaceae bacterium]|nr:hypothetical protein [Candidatus Promineifilaceae bacterium]
MTKVTLDKKAPDFVLQDFQGNVISLSQFKGEKHVLLIFNRGFT